MPSGAHESESLVLTHQGLAKRLAWRYAHGDRDLLEELEQVAALGLVKAARRFDRSRAVSFSTFAVPTIAGELRHHFRSTRWMAHVPRRLQESYLAALRIEGEMTAEMGRPPGVAALAERLGWTVERLLEARGAADALSWTSLDGPPSADDAEVPLAERLGGEDPGYERLEIRDEVEQALGALDPRAEQAVRLRYGEQLTFGEVAARIGVSSSYASKLAASALHELRATLQLQAA
jgi:RNA polymerase sigma-B factor